MVVDDELRTTIYKFFDMGGMPKFDALSSDGFAFCPYWETGGAERIESLSTSVSNDWYTYDFADKSVSSWTLDDVLSGRSGFNARAIALLLCPTIPLFCSRSPLEVELLAVRNGDSGDVFKQRMRRDILLFEHEMEQNTQYYSSKGLKMLEQVVIASHASLEP